MEISSIGRKARTLVRIDYLAQNRSVVGNVAKRVSPRGKVLYTIGVGRVQLSLLFDDFNLARTENGFMVQNSALYLKCPPLPSR